MFNNMSRSWKFQQIIWMFKWKHIHMDIPLNNQDNRKECHHRYPNSIDKAVPCCYNAFKKHDNTIFIHLLNIITQCLQSSLEEKGFNTSRKTQYCIRYVSNSKNPHCFSQNVINTKGKLLFPEEWHLSQIGKEIIMASKWYGKQRKHYWKGSLAFLLCQNQSGQEHDTKWEVCDCLSL